MLRIVLSSHHLQGCRFLQHLQETLTNFRLIMLFFSLYLTKISCVATCACCFLSCICAFKTVCLHLRYTIIYYIQKDISLAYLFLRLNKLNFFSVSSHGTRIRTLIILVIPSWINASSFRMFWQWGGQTRYSCSSTFSQILKQERESLLHSCLAISLLSSLHVADSTSIWNYQISLCNVSSYPDST